MIISPQRTSPFNLPLVSGGFTGLLDTYGGAAAAYSVRRLSSTYEGALIEVRRSSDNTTQDIGFDANGDLDTAALLSFVGAGDGFVRTWYDQSGNGNNAQKTTTTNQPQIVSSGSLIIENGKVGIQFNDGNDVLTHNTSFIYETAFSVAKINLITIANYISWDNTNNVGFGYGGTLIGLDGLFIFDGSANSLTGENLNQKLGYFNDTSANLEIAENGSSSTLFSRNKNLSSESLSRTNISVYFNGIMQEVLFYGSSQSSKRSNIESNINSYFSIY